MKIYKTELPEAADLDDMVLGGNPIHGGGAIVPDPEDPAEVPEVEWQLLQSPPVDKPGAGAFEKGEAAGEVGEGNESVLRRYEYYKYTGAYDPDPENLGEAFCDNPLSPDQQVPERCGAPNAEGVAGVGDLIGAQNAAANLVPLCATDVGAAISVTRSGYLFNPGTRLFTQKVTLKNTSDKTIFGPISLVLDDLSLSGPDGLYNLSGNTSCTVPQNSPYIDTSVNTSDAGLAPGASLTVVLKFSDGSRTPIRYNTRVLSTAGSR